MAIESSAISMRERRLRREAVIIRRNIFLFDIKPFLLSQ